MSNLSEVVRYSLEIKCERALPRDFGYQKASQSPCPPCVALFMRPSVNFISLASGSSEIRPHGKVRGNETSCQSRCRIVHASDLARGTAPLQCSSATEPVSNLRI